MRGGGGDAVQGGGEGDVRGAGGGGVQAGLHLALCLCSPDDGSDWKLTSEQVVEEKCSVVEKEECSLKEEEQCRVETTEQCNQVLG